MLGKEYLYQNNHVISIFWEDPLSKNFMHLSAQAQGEGH